MIDLFNFTRVTYRLGNSQRWVEVSGYLKAGGVLFVQGPSGSGKSTLLRILSRLQEGESGQAYFRGTPWQSFSPAEWRRQVHYNAQTPAMFKGTVLANLQKPFELSGRIKNEKFDLKEAINGMKRLLLPEEMLQQEARTLSGGEAARIALLRSVLFNPCVLMLDEPTAALDGQARKAVLEFILAWLEAVPERGLLLVSHTGDLKDLPMTRVLDIGENGGIMNG